MNGTPGFDYPEEMSPVDVQAASRGDALMSFVEKVGDDELVLTVGKDRAQRPVRLEPGERLDLVWKDPTELRALPAELVAVQTGEQSTWRIRPVGPATRGQRRNAVRAPLAFRIRIGADNNPREGQTVDISEGGARLVLDGEPAADPAVTAEDSPAGPGGSDADVHEHTGQAVAAAEALEVGAVFPVTIWLDDRDYVAARGELIRRHDRTDRREELSVRFIGLTEHMEDLVRRHVFAGMRDLRARGLL
jgi:hypothetical protein